MMKKVPTTLLAAGSILALTILAVAATRRTTGSPAAAPSTAADGGHTMTMDASDRGMGTSGVNALRSLRGSEFDIAFLSQMIVAVR